MKRLLLVLLRANNSINLAPSFSSNYYYNRSVDMISEDYFQTIITSGATVALSSAQERAWSYFSQLKCEMIGESIRFRYERSCVIGLQTLGQTVRVELSTYPDPLYFLIWYAIFKPAVFRCFLEFNLLRSLVKKILRPFRCLFIRCFTYWWLSARYRTAET